MNKSFIFFLLLLPLAFLISCKEEKLPNEIVMQNLLDHNPDSLAYILEETINLNLLPEKDRNDYIWWLARTHSKQYRSLVNDTLIYKVLDYHKQIDSPLLITTYKLAAQHAKSKGEISKEKELLGEALAVAQNRRDTTTAISLCSELAYLYQNRIDDDKIKNLAQIIKSYNFWNTDTYMTLSRLYDRLNDLDSIAKYSSLGIKTAVKEGRPKEEYLMTRIYVEYLNQSKQSDKALSTLRELERKMPIGEGIVGNEIKFNYITTWIALGQYDSAKVYINFFDPLLLAQSKTNFSADNIVFKSVLDIFRSIIHSKQGGVFSTRYLISANHMLDNGRANILAEKERIYAQNKLQQDKLNLELEKGKLQQRLLWIAITVVVVVAILIFVYQRKLLKKERKLQSIKDQLRVKSLQVTENELIINRNEQYISSLNSQLGENEEIKQELEQLVAENEKIKEKNASLLKEIQIHSALISKKDEEQNFLEDLSIQNGKLIEREQFLTTQLIKKTPVLNDLNKNPRYVDESQWHDIIHDVDQLFNAFSVRLRIDFPTLTEEDIRYCCLFKLRLSNSIISSLMGISPSSVTKRKQRIKEKLNQYKLTSLEQEKTLEVFLWNYY